MEKTLYTFTKFDYLDMKFELQELFEIVSYLDNCSSGQTDDFKESMKHIYLRIDRIKSILNFKYLFPSGI